jgi:hypothetical protein
MNDARRTHDWDQSALIWSAIANTARDPKTQRKPFSPGIVHPYRREKDYEPKPIEASIDVLRMLLHAKGEPQDGSGSD